MPYPSKAQYGGLVTGVISDPCGALVETYFLAFATKLSDAINAVLTGK